MLATTRYVLTQALTIEQGDAPGTFGVVNRDASAVIVITVEAITGSIDDVTLYVNGDSASFELEDVRRITIRAYTPGGAETYPATILILATNLPISLVAAPSLSSSPSTPVYVQPVRAGTAIPSAVPQNAADVELLATNAARLGATIYNDAAATLYVQLGPTADTASDFMLIVAAAGYFEVPFGYTGAIHGIWSGAGAGQAVISELTA